MSKPYFTQTIYNFSDRLVGGSDSAFISTAAELKFNRNPAMDVAADCLAAPRRNFEADSAAHGSALHLYITCELLLCVRLGMSRDRRCGHHAAGTHSKIVLLYVYPNPKLVFWRKLDKSVNKMRI